MSKKDYAADSERAEQHKEITYARSTDFFDVGLQPRKIVLQHHHG